MLPAIQVLVGDVMYVSQGGIPMFGGGGAYQWSCAWHMSLPHGIINQYETQLTRRKYSLEIC